MKRSFGTSGSRAVPYMIGFATLALALGCAKDLPTQPPLTVGPTTFGSGEMLDVDNLFILADASGSTYMEETFPQSKSLATTFIKALPDTDGSRPYRVGYTAFGGDERVSVPLGPVDRAKLLDAAERTTLMGQIDGTGGTTPIDAVLTDVASQLQQARGSTAIVLISDGNATDTEAALAAGEALFEGRSDRTALHAVQLGESEDGGELLRSLAGMSDGGSVRTADSISSPQSFSRFAKNIMVGEAPLPAVAAGPPCDSSIRLRGIEFGFDKYDIDDAGAVVLDVAASTLESCPDLGVRIDGHTDSTGPEVYNQGLSERRAGAVQQYFEQQGIAGGRLSSEGFGESQPIMSNDTREGRARNRRVELHPR